MRQRPPRVWFGRSIRLAILLPLAVLAFLLVLNGVFAMAELAVMTSRQSRLQQAAARGNRGAAAALQLAHEPTRFLSTVQVGITLIGILAGAFGENALSGKVQEAVATVPALERYSDQIALVVVVLGITYFSLVVGELVPKRIALAYPEAVASTIAPPLRTLSRVAAWPIRVLTLSTEGLLRLLRVKPGATADVSEEDVRSIIARAASTGVFNPHEHALFQRVLRAGDLTAAALMVPRADIVWIDENEPLDSVRVLVGTSPHSHFPICRGSLDSVVGVVHIKDLIAYGLLGGADFKATAVAQRPVFIPETMPALRLLDQLQKSRMHLAFVVDEYGGTQGLITLNDVVRALVGDIARGAEEPAPGAQQREDGSWLIDGAMPLHELTLVLKLPPEAEEQSPSVHTTGGLVLALLGHLPVPGEHATWQGYRLEVVDMDGTRIDKVLAVREPASGGSAAG